MDEYEMEIVEPLHRVLERSDNPDEEWLWCMFCEHFFQAKQLRTDYPGNRQGCAFCGAAGFNCAIVMWDLFREDDDPSWPAEVSDLCHGLKLGSEPS